MCMCMNVSVCVWVSEDIHVSHSLLTVSASNASHLNQQHVKLCISSMWDLDVWGRTWELISVTRSNSRVTAAGVGSSLKAWVAWGKQDIFRGLDNFRNKGISRRVNDSYTGGYELKPTEDLLNYIHTAANFACAMMSDSRHEEQWIPLIGFSL